MADQQIKRKRTFRKFTYRGRDLENLVDITVSKKYTELMGLLHARARRRLTRGLKRKAVALLRKVKAAIKAAKYVDGVLQKPDTVKTHLRNMIIVPEMIGGVVGVYNGQSFTTVEIKPPMVGHYLGEFSITYKPIKHGRPGIGATNSSRFIPLK